MRDLVGHKITMVVDGFPKILSGILVSEDQTFAHIQSEVEKEQVWRIPKSKICGFMSPDVITNFLPFHVLFCDNPAVKCKGVRYIKQGEGFSRKELDEFMAPCPRRSIDCRCGSKGELRTVGSELLEEMFTGVLFGDYPEAEKETDNGGRGAKIEPSEGGSGKVVEGRKPNTGRNKQSPSS